LNYPAVIGEASCRAGMRTLRDDGALKVKAGVTTVSSVFPVSSERQPFAESPDHIVSLNRAEMAPKISMNPASPNCRCPGTLILDKKDFVTIQVGAPFDKIVFIPFAHPMGPSDIFHELERT